MNTTAFAQEKSVKDKHYCSNQKLGYYFYCDTQKKKKKGKPNIQKQKLSAAEQIEIIQNRLTELKQIAVMEPTETNILNYIKFQRQQLDRATKFTDQWQRVLWQNPAIDYNLSRPPGGIAKKVWLDQRKIDQTNTVNDLGERYGIFYFFQGTCRYCQKFSPILKTFANKHSLNVQAISLDGLGLQDWPQFTVDTGQYDRLGLTGNPVPAVVLFDAKTKKVMPVTFGLISIQDLSDRIYSLVSQEVGNDY